MGAGSVASALLSALLSALGLPTLSTLFGGRLLWVSGGRRWSESRVVSIDGAHHACRGEGQGWLRSSGRRKLVEPVLSWMPANKWEINEG